MVCAPVIALVEIASAGALSSAIGTALGSQILGGAVLGLIASGGKPEGALLGGLASAFSGAAGGLGEGAGGAAGADSAAGKLATDTVANNVSASADEFFNMPLNELTDATQSIGVAGADAAADTGSSAASSGAVNNGPISKAKETIGGEKTPPAKGGILARIEGIAKEYPNLTKIGLGGIEQIGKAKMNEDTWRLRAQLEHEDRLKAGQYAYGSMDTSLGFKPGTSGYQSPLQKYMKVMQS